MKAVADLGGRIADFHSDTALQSAIAASPKLVQLSTDISQQARTIENNFKNIGTAISHIPQSLVAVESLAGDFMGFQDDPITIAAIAANPTLKTTSDALSADVRSIEEAFGKVSV